MMGEESKNGRKRPAHKQALVDATQEAGLSLQGLSLELRRNNAYLQQYVNRASPPDLAEADRIFLARRLSVDAGILMSSNLRARVSRVSGGVIRKQRVESPFTPHDMLPIEGRARAGDDSIILEGGRVGYTERPVWLLGADEAFAVYINGDSMSPRFRHGELVYIAPHKPYAPGDDVLIEFEDGTGVVKELKRQNGETVDVLQHNPPRDLSYDRVTIKRIYLIDGSRRRG